MQINRRKDKSGYAGFILTEAGGISQEMIDNGTVVLGETFTGGIVTNPIILPGPPMGELEATSKSYVDSKIAEHTSNSFIHLTIDQQELVEAITVSASEINRLTGLTSNVATELNKKLNLTGGMMAGYLYLNDNPTAALHAATKQYVDSADITKVNKSGDIMTGYLVLQGDPTASFHAASKQYIDLISSLKVNKSGDTMTGALMLPFNPTANLHAATKQYVDSTLLNHSNNDALHITAAQNSLLDSIVVTSSEINQLTGVNGNLQNQIDSKLSLSGGTLLDFITLSNNPVENLHAATKQYVDSSSANLQTQIVNIQNNISILNLDPVTKTYVDDQDTTKVSKLGDTMAGTLILSGDPSASLHAATKQYVDNQDNTKISKAGDTMLGALTLADNPVADYHAATKQYVDNGLNTKVSISQLGIANGIATLDTDGKVPAIQLPSYVDDIAEYANLSAFPVTGEAGKIYIALDTNKTYRWSGSVYVYITSGAVDSVAGKTGVVLLDKNDVGLSNVDNTADAGKNVLSATRFTTARNINGISFNGTSDIVITDTTKVSKSGDTMSGLLTLSEDPVLGLHAATKQYVDMGLTLKANLASPILTGIPLAPTPVINTYTAQLATTAFVINQASTSLPLGNGSSAVGSETTFARADHIHPTDTSRVSKAGDTMTGALTLFSNPTANLHAATKQYVDNGLSSKVNSSLLGIANGIATLDIDGKVPASQLPSYVDDISEYANLAAFPVIGETGKIYIALDTNKTYRWSGSVYVFITSGAVDSVAGKTGVVLLDKGDVGLSNVDNTADAAKNVLSASRFTTARTINDVTFDGTTNITIADATKVAKAGDTMTGLLTLSANPTANLHAATKQYVDTALALKANLASPALTGTPTAPTAASGTNTTQIATTAYVIGRAATTLPLVNGTATIGTLTMFARADHIHPSDTSKVSKAGDTMTGLLSLFGDPTANLHAATKQYVDTLVSSNVSKSGDTMSGLLTLSGNPIINLHAATKQYVDNGLTSKLDSSLLGVANGIATLDLTGKVPASQLPSYVDDVLEFANLAAFPVTGETGKIYIALDTNKPYRWSGSAYVYITSGAVDSVAGKTGVVLLDKNDVGLSNVDNTTDAAKNVLSASKLTTARSINGITFDGTANIVITDASRVAKAGDSMTGPLSLSGDPTAALHATTKQYVDTNLGTKVAKTGDTMTGALTLNANPTSNLHAATKQYVDTLISEHSVNETLHITAAQNTLLDELIVTSGEINRLVGISGNVQAQLDNKLSRTGDAMLGALTLAADPINPLHAATKQYVDNIQTIDPSLFVSKVNAAIMIADRGVSIGDVIIKTSPVIPPNMVNSYLRCNGSIISKTIYSELFNSIGSTYENSLLAGSGKHSNMRYGIESGIIYGPWTTFSNNLPKSASYLKPIVTANKVHLLCGITNNSASNSIFTADILSDGSLGSWNETNNALPIRAYGSQVVVHNNFVYMIGGYSGSTYYKTVFRTTIDINGDLGIWEALDDIPITKAFHQAIITKNRIWLIGGFNGSYSSIIYSAVINPDGSLGIWVAHSSNLPTSSAYQAVVIIKNILYVFGNFTGSYSSTVYYSYIDADGILSDFKIYSAIGLPSARQYNVLLTNTKLYLIGGFTGSYLTTMYESNINSDGSIEPFKTTTAFLPLGLIEGGAFVTRNKFFLAGGTNSAASRNMYMISFTGGDNDQSKYYNGSLLSNANTFRIPDYSYEESIAREPKYYFIKAKYEAAI